MDTVPELPQRKTSVSTKESSHGSDLAVPALTQPHRRMSRIEPPGAFSSMNRRMSMYRRPSIAGSHRTDDSRPTMPVKLQNTYRVEPKEDERFNSSRVEKALHSILESFLADEKYDPKKSSTLAQSLTNHVKDRVKEMHFPRYKLVCSVMVGQGVTPSMQFASRSCWNPSTDAYACAAYQNGSLMAVATVYGLYFE